MNNFSIYGQNDNLMMRNNSYAINQFIIFEI